MTENDHNPTDADLSKLTFGSNRHHPSEQKLKGTNLKHSHVHNQRVILETVRLRGPLSRAEISNYTSLTAQTVSNIVDKLLSRGVMETIGRRSGQRGQPAIEININPQGGYSVGVQIDRDHLTVVLLDLSGRCLETAYRPWSYPTPDEAIPLISEMVQELAVRQRLRVDDLWGIGVGLPGPVDFQAGALMNPPNFPGWDGFPLRLRLTEKLNIPVYLETDATAAAEGERWFGHGRNVDDFFYIFFGIGLGGGMIVNGQPYRGALGNAGMFGHIPVDPKGARCACGGVGCLELYASISSLYEALKQSGISIMNLSESEAMLADSNPNLLHWMDTSAEHLTSALVTIEHLISPKAIIFGGQLPSSLQAWLIKELEQRLTQRRMKALTMHPRLIQATALDNSIALGAATLPLFGQFTPGNQVEPAFANA